MGLKVYCHTKFQIRSPNDADLAPTCTLARPPYKRVCIQGCW